MQILLQTKQTRSRRTSLKAHLHAALTCTVILLGSNPLRAQAKPQITGLVSMGDIGFAKIAGVNPDNDCEEIRQHTNVFDGQVINVTWRQLQNGYGNINTTAIDAALSKIAVYNANHTPKAAAKLRVWAGVNAPQWVMSGGASVTVQLPTGAHPVNSCPANANAQPDSTTSATIPLYWTESYRQNLKALQTLLANKYDAPGSGIEEVSVSACSSSTDEPFVEPLGSGQALVLAGYTDMQMEDCLNRMAHTYSAWVRTSLEYPIALLHTINPNSPYNTTEDDAVMYTVMDGWLQSQAPNGPAHILSNHALVAVPQGTTPQTFQPQCQLAPLYTHMCAS